MVRVPDFDPNTPSIAGVYDYFVGRKIQVVHGIL
jgi:hypothetical protein